MKTLLSSPIEMTNGSNMLVVDREVVASPLKQEILRLNEENYYLKLEVIKLVSTLKGTPISGGGSDLSRKRKQPATESEPSVKDSPFVATPDEMDCFSLIDIPPDTPQLATDFSRIRQLPLTPSSKIDYTSNNDTNDFLFIDSNDVENTFNTFISS